jgi:hypothetical protein
MSNMGLINILVLYYFNFLSSVFLLHQGTMYAILDFRFEDN